MPNRAFSQTFSRCTNKEYQQLPWLKEASVAYVNIDVAVSGPRPAVAATPQLHQLAVELMKKVIFPYNGSSNITLYDMWYAGSEGEIDVLGSGSDYTSFVHNGIPSVSISYHTLTFSPPNICRSTLAPTTAPTTPSTTTTPTTTPSTGWKPTATPTSAPTSQWANT
jgi:hypothetical protein